MRRALTESGDRDPCTVLNRRSAPYHGSARMSLGGRPAQFQQLTPQGVGGPGGLQQQQVDFLSALMRPGFGAPGGGLEQFFGGLGSPTTPLQRQSTDAIGAFLRQPSPEERALQTSMPMLQNILDSRPGQGIMDALQPQFQRNLASANQQGGRFGSANAIMRGRALEDFNLLGANAAQQGQQTQLQAAQMLSMLANNAGQNPFARLMGAYGVGQQGAQQDDLETQRRIQLLAGLLGQAQGAAFNNPWTQTKAASGGLGGFLGSLAGLGLGAFTGGLGSAAAGALGGKIFGGGK